MADEDTEIREGWDGKAHKRTIARKGAVGMMTLQEVWEVEHIALDSALAFALEFPGGTDVYGSPWDEKVWDQAVVSIETHIGRCPSRMGHDLFLAVLHEELDG
jgi:hypothetical protein